VVLLERIRDYGSITKAAKSMGMSYRNAWELVASMNKLSEKPLVDRFSGGKGGGGTVLTKHGEKSIALFWKLRSDFLSFLNKKEKKLFAARNVQNAKIRK
jgi:molybdate transport system regulatory protein